MNGKEANHWHQFTWEVDQAAPAEWRTSVLRRPKVLPGQVSRIDPPGDDAREWHANGVGAYVAGKGVVVSASVLWRCGGECPKLTG